MNYETQGRDARSIGQEKVIGGEVRQSTLNERLNVSLDRLQMEADRLERALNRVNGAPGKEGLDANRLAGATPARPVRSLAQVTEEFETLTSRFRNLNEGVDQVA